MITQSVLARAGLSCHTGALPSRRFAVYRNNVRVGLIGALAARFPATQSIVGEEFFTALAAEFIQRHPPVSPLLLAYGDGFADFAETFPPLAGLPYLPDVIRLEAARSHAYHAADVSSLDGSALAALPTCDIADIRLTLHPSASLLLSRYPVVTLWAMNAGEASLAPVADWGGEAALIIRPHLTVLVHRLPPGAADFARALAMGRPLGAAAVQAAARDPRFDIPTTLAGLIAAGLFTALVSPSETRHE
jgi:hypothetical protein